jgi:TonB family protein
MRRLARLFVIALVAAGMLSRAAHAQQEGSPATQDGPGEVTPNPTGPVQLPDGSYRPGHGVTFPKLLEPGAGHYSQEALEAGYMVTGLVACTVDATGAANRVSAGLEFDNGLREEAANAVRSSRFQPGQLGGEPVPVRYRVAVSFRIADGKPEVAVYDPAADELATLTNAHRAQVEARGQRGMRSGSGLNRPDPPRLLHSVEAEFSDEARKAKYQGVVTVSALVTADGRTTDIQILDGLKHGLNEKAVEAVSQYRFAPATQDGNPVPYRLNVQVSFRLY